MALTGPVGKKGILRETGEAWGGETRSQLTDTGASNTHEQKGTVSTRISGGGTPPDPILACFDRDTVLQTEAANLRRSEDGSTQHLMTSTSMPAPRHVYEGS